MAPAPGPAPPALSPYADSAGSTGPLHLRPDPRRRIWVAPWVQNNGLGRPLFALFGLVPMAVLLVLTPAVRADVLAHQDPRRDGLTTWAFEDPWRVPVTLLVIAGMPWLHYLRGRLHRQTEADARFFAAATAVFWLVWVAAVALNLGWAWGMSFGYHVEDVSLDHTLLDLTTVMGWLLLANGLMAPFILVAALIRLVRALTGDVARPAVG
ncbi:hypothetical protein [Streptomyces sp. SBT349]|uniref:hypothetical protein n=1 Tax=Streptomyces sp. SBT349 TaxID=1580539 RepID=UPI00066B409C|nr:hypothetical protein [Streptomyces sp. SBT349]